MVRFRSSSRLHILHINWKFNTACNKYGDVSNLVYYCSNYSIQPNPTDNERRSQYLIYYYGKAKKTRCRIVNSSANSASKHNFETICHYRVLDGKFERLIHYSVSTNLKKVAEREFAQQYKYPKQCIPME